LEETGFIANRFEVHIGEQSLAGSLLFKRLLNFIDGFWEESFS
jgi:hypothetical protein